jgi:hypothetical protein
VTERSRRSLVLGILSHLEVVSSTRLHLQPHHDIILRLGVGFSTQIPSW